MQVPMAQIRVLGDQEDQQTIQDWFNQVTAITRASRAWGDYLDAEWTPHSVDINRGFTDTEVNGNKTVTKEKKSREVESLLNYICTFAPHLDSINIRSEAWVEEGQEESNDE